MRTSAIAELTLLKAPHQRELIRLLGVTSEQMERFIGITVTWMERKVGFPSGDSLKL